MGSSSRPKLQPIDHDLNALSVVDVTIFLPLPLPRFFTTFSMSPLDAFRSPELTPPRINFHRSGSMDSDTDQNSLKVEYSQTTNHYMTLRQ